jgi:thioredoxin-like negative regulator of GroEL
LHSQIIHSSFPSRRCGTSVRLQPSIKKLAASFASQIEFARINVHAHPSVAQRYLLRAYPVFGVFTQSGKLHFWLQKKLSANSLFNLITRVAKAPDWVG